MKPRSFKLIPFCMLWGTLLSLVWVLNWGCGSSALNGGSGGSGTGGGSDGSAGDSGISIRGSVEVPGSVNTSQGLSNKSLEESSGSVSKSAVVSSGTEGEAPSGMTAKATFKPSSGDVVAKNFAGTVLDSGTIGPTGEITGLLIDPAKLGSDKQVVLEVKVGTGSTTLYIQHDLSGKKTGDTVTETVTTNTSLAALQVLAACGSDTTFGNLSSCASAVSAGSMQPDALYKVYKNMSGTAGTGSLGAMNEAMRKIFEGSIAAGKPPSPSDMLAMIQGNASKIAEYTSAASLSYDATALAKIKEFPSACKSYFNSTVKAKFDSGGDAAYRDAGADFFANLDPSKGDLTNIIDQPDLYRNLVGEFLDDFNAGNTSALGAFEKSDFARMMAELGDEVTASGMTSAQYDALKTQMMGGSWGNQDPAKMAAAFGNLVSASDDSTEVAYWSKLDIFGNPDLFGGASGKNMFDQQFIQLAQGGGTASFTPCTTSANCAVGKVCSTTCFKCVDETNSGIGLSRCEKCTANSQCGTSYCNPAGFCNYPLGFTGNPLGTVFKPQGASCTTGSECWSGSCIAGICGGLSAPSGVAATKAYNRLILAWAVSPSPGVTTQKIYRSTAQGFTPGAATLIATFSNNTTISLNNTGLTNGTAYYYRLETVNFQGNVNLSDEFSGTPGVAIPTAISTGQRFGVGGADVAWGAVEGATNYDVFYKQGTGVTTLDSTTNVLTDASTTIGGLLNNELYCFRLRASDGGETTGLSTEDCTYTNTCGSGGALARPTGLSATSTASGTVTVSWTAVSYGGECGGSLSYRIYYRQGSNVTTENSSTTTTASTSANISPLTSGTQYCFRVRAEVSSINVTGKTAEVCTTPQ